MRMSDEAERRRIEYAADDVDAAQVADAVAEYIDDHGDGVQRTIRRHFDEGREAQAQAMVDQLIEEVKRYVPFADEYNQLALNEFVMDAIDSLG